MVRQPADWMQKVDERILEALSERGNLTPRAVDHFGITSQKHASNRLSVLAKHGLVNRITRGLYELTDDGEAFLAGDLDAATLTAADTDD